MSSIQVRCLVIKSDDLTLLDFNLFFVDFRSKDENITLVPEEDFYKDAPESITRTVNIYLLLFNSIQMNHLQEN